MSAAAGASAPSKAPLLGEEITKELNGLSTITTDLLLGAVDAAAEARRRGVPEEVIASALKYYRTQLLVILASLPPSDRCIHTRGGRR